MKNPNKEHATISDLKVQKISTSKEGIGMYAVTFKIGQKFHSQTRHMTEVQAEGFTPSIEVVQSGGRTLQKSSFKSGDAK